MKANRKFRDDVAGAEVVSAIILFGLFVTVLAFLNVTSVPASGLAAEESHQTQVLASLNTLQTDAESAALPGSAGATIARSVDLAPSRTAGSDFFSFFLAQPAQASGELTFVANYGNITISHWKQGSGQIFDVGSATSAFPMGRLTFNPHPVFKQEGLMQLEDGALVTTTPTTLPPSIVSNRRSRNARWISSRTPPAIITTTPNMIALPRVCARSCSGLCGTLRSAGTTSCRISNTPRTTAKDAGMSATPKRISRPVAREPKNMSRGDSRCARKKKKTSPTSTTVSTSVSEKTNAGDSCPPTSGRIPNVVRTVMMISCVGKPEQRMTSSAAAARSMGSTPRWQGGPMISGELWTAPSDTPRM